MQKIVAMVVMLWALWWSWGFAAESPKICQPDKVLRFFQAMIAQDYAAIPDLISPATPIDTQKIVDNARAVDKTLKAQGIEREWIAWIHATETDLGDEKLCIFLVDMRQDREFKDVKAYAVIRYLVATDAQGLVSVGPEEIRYTRKVSK